MNSKFERFQKEAKVLRKNEMQVLKGGFWKKVSKAVKNTK